MTFVLWMIGLMVVTEILFASIMELKRYMSTKPRWAFTTVEVVTAPILILGLVCDALVNYLPATILCLQFPRWKEWLTTWRLHRYVNTVPIPTKGLPAWRFKLALWVCDTLLNPFQKNHCGEPADVMLGSWKILSKPV